MEDVGKTSLLKDMAQMRYDDDQSYLNSKVLVSLNIYLYSVFPSVAQIFFLTLKLPPSKGMLTK